MLNLLIADYNINYARNLMHFINSTSDNVRVFDISINGKETFEILNRQNNIDIVILDLNMPLSNGTEIIDQLTYDQSNKYNNSFIIISEDIRLIEEVKSLKSNLIYKVLFKNSDFRYIINNINELITQKSITENIDKVRIKISNQLISIGYSLSHIGTQYLIDIIEMSYLKSGNLIKNLNKCVYPIIAKRYGQSNSTVLLKIIED